MMIRESYVCWRKKLPIMTVIFDFNTLIIEIIRIIKYAKNGIFNAIIGRTFLFFGRMCVWGVQGYQQYVPDATGWLPVLLPEDFSRNSL